MNPAFSLSSPLSNNDDGTGIEVFLAVPHQDCVALAILPPHLVSPLAVGRNISVGLEPTV